MHASPLSLRRCHVVLHMLRRFLPALDSGNKESNSLDVFGSDTDSISLLVNFVVVFLLVGPTIFKKALDLFTHCTSTFDLSTYVNVRERTVRERA